MRKILITTIWVVSFVFTNCKTVDKYKNLEVVDSKEFKVADFNPTIMGIGTEPFWNIEVSNDYVIYTTPEKANEIYKRIDNSEVAFIIAENKEGRIELNLSKNDCSDGMSDQNFDHKLDLTIIKNKESRQYSGCAKYTTPKLVQGKWELSYFLGKEIPVNQFLKTPYLLFDVDPTKISGNSSCNSFNGLMVLNGNRLSFSNLAVTEMMCVHENMETKFLKVLPTITKYELIDDELHLFEKEVVLMKFKKIDK